MDNQNNNTMPPAPISPPPAVPPQQPAQPKTFHLTLINKISIFLISLILLGLGGYFFLSTPGKSSRSNQQPSPTLAAQSPTATLTPSSQTTEPAAPTDLKVICDTTNQAAILTWTAVPKTDFYFLHVKGETQIDTRVYATSHTVNVEPGKKYSWWIEAVNHNADFSQSYSSKSIGGPEINC